MFSGLNYEESTETKAQSSVIVSHGTAIEGLPSLQKVSEGEK
jgi:hypothetical protein